MVGLDSTDAAFMLAASAVDELARRNKLLSEALEEIYHIRNSKTMDKANEALKANKGEA